MADRDASNAAANFSGPATTHNGHSRYFGIQPPLRPVLRRVTIVTREGPKVKRALTGGIGGGRPAQGFQQAFVPTGEPKAVPIWPRSLAPRTGRCDTTVRPRRSRRRELWGLYLRIRAGYCAQAVSLGGCCEDAPAIG
jgi:hypothetical protein